VSEFEEIKTSSMHKVPDQLVPCGKSSLFKTRCTGERT